MLGHPPAGAEQISLPMPAPKPTSRVADGTPEEAAKVAIARRAKPSVVPGHVKLVVTLELARSVAEQLSAPEVVNDCETAGRCI
jgi:hypothetical protein